MNDYEHSPQTPDSFTIYQLKNGDGTRALHFEPYDRLLAAGHTVDPANYNAVYTAPLAPDMSLDDIFYIFNMERPKDFTGHSLSVSDVIVLHRDGKDTAHYIDSVGYKPLPDFLADGTPAPPKAERPSVREQLKAGKKKAAQKKPALSKFENVDVFDALGAIMKQNTASYQGDFETDKRIFAEAVDMPSAEYRTFLWLCRPYGTHCFRERDVFIRDTPYHSIWRFYKEHTHDRMLAYAVEVTGMEDGKIRGNIYELDYAKHCERVKETALPADTVKGLIPTRKHLTETSDPQSEEYARYEYLPRDPDALQDILREERKRREQLAPGNFTEHIAALHDGLIEYEARRVVTEMKRLDGPNSPSKTHFMVQLSPAFVCLASTADVDRLFSMLPYKSLLFSKIKNMTGTYALISKHENRDVSIRKSRPKRKIQKYVSR